MKVKLRNEQIPLNALVIVLIVAIILFPSNALRIVLGLPFLLFFPGYALMAALFPKREGMPVLERILLSFGTSIAVVPVMAFILNYTPLGIRLEPVLYSVASFIFITSIIAWLRRRRLPEADRFGIEFQLGLPGWGTSTLDKSLTIVLVVGLLGVVVLLGYAVVKPKIGERFTEFYILGPEGRAADYPGELRPGETGNVTVVITNREHRVVSYRVEASIGEVRVGVVGPVLLAHGESWNGTLAFTPTRVGDSQQVEFYLYKDGEVSSERLSMWISKAR